MLKLNYPATGKFFYASPYSAGFDISSQTETVIQPGCWKLIETGLFISDFSGIMYTLLGQKIIPEIQIRSRSGMSVAYGITILGGICTIDSDYKSAIRVPLINNGTQQYVVKVGDRIAQGVCALTVRLDSFETVRVERSGGFGSTGK